MIFIGNLQTMKYSTTRSTNQLFYIQCSPSYLTEPDQRYCPDELRIRRQNLSNDSGHSTHFQVGGDNPNVEGEILQNQYAKQSVFYFRFDKVAGKKSIQTGNLPGALLLWNALVTYTLFAHVKFSDWLIFLISIHIRKFIQI